MNKSNSTLLNVNLTIISLVIVFYIFYIGASFIIPFVIALLLAFSLISTYSFFKKITRSSVFSFILVIFLYIGIFRLLYIIINTNILNISEKSAFYQDQLRFIIDKNVARFQIKEGEFYQRMWGYIDLPTILTNMAGLITNVLGYAGIITFYLIFIVLEYKYFGKKIHLMFKDEEKQRKILDIIQELKQDIKVYFLIKIFVSLLTGLLAYIMMKILGLDFALFWAFLVFVLNFIPNIGSFIAAFFPVVLSLIQFDDYYHFFIVMGGFVFINLFVGNFIEPILTGNKLNLSPLVTLIALVFWGSIWGIPGMFLSVPIMVITSIIFSKFESTKSFAILLSEKGDLKSDIELDFEKNKTKILQKIKKIFI